MKKSKMIFPFILGLFLSSCGSFITVSHHHVFKDTFVYDDSCHWKGTMCAHEEEKIDSEPHEYENGKCVVCGYIEHSVDYLTFQEISILSTPYYGVIKCDNSAIEISIPHYYENRRIDCMIEKSFADCTNLTTIVIPNCIDQWQEGALKNCTALTNVILQDGLREIGYSAFSGCTALKHIDIPDSVYQFHSYIFSDCSSLESIKFPNQPIEISDRMFESCTSLKSIVIPSNILGISAFAFSKCTALTNIEFQNGLTYIDWHAFEKCFALTDVVFPNSVTHLKEGIFDGCIALNNVYIPDSITEIDGPIFNSYPIYDMEEPIPNVTSFLTVFCETEKEPQNWKSDWDKSIAHVVWGYQNEKVVENGISYALCEKDGSKFYKAFAFDRSRDMIEIPSSINGIPVTTINDSAFEKCFSLKSVTLSNGITSIGKSAFASCTSLTNISIPDSVTYIGDGAFSQC